MYPFTNSTNAAMSLKVLKYPSDTRTMHHTSSSCLLPPRGMPLNISFVSAHARFSFPMRSYRSAGCRRYFRHAPGLQ